MIVYKGQGINWHPQSDSLGVSPLKWTCSTHPFVSGLRHLVESLRQLTCFIGCFMPTTVGPCLYAHQLPQLYQGQGGPAFDSRIKEAFILTDQLGVTPSCKTIYTLNACISAPIGETTLSLIDNGQDLEPFGYPPADLPPILSLDAVMADMSSTAASLAELSSDKEEPAQAPPTKQKRTHGLHGSCCCAIEPPPADHWSESDDEFVDIYGLVDGNIAQTAGLDNGWPHMIRQPLLHHLHLNVHILLSPPTCVMVK